MTINSTNKKNVRNGPIELTTAFFSGISVLVNLLVTPLMTTSKSTAEGCELSQNKQSSVRINYEKLVVGDTFRKDECKKVSLTQTFKAHLTVFTSTLATADVSSKFPRTMLPTGSKNNNRGMSVKTKMRRCLLPVCASFLLEEVLLDGGKTSCLNTWPHAST